MTEATLSDLPRIFDFSTARSEAAKAVMIITSVMTEGITDPRIRRVSIYRFGGRQGINTSHEKTMVSKQIKACLLCVFCVSYTSISYASNLAIALYFILSSLWPSVSMHASEKRCGIKFFGDMWTPNLTTTKL